MKAAVADSRSVASLVEKVLTDFLKKNGYLGKWLPGCPEAIRRLVEQALSKKWCAVIIDGTERSLNISERAGLN